MNQKYLFLLYFPYFFQNIFLLCRDTELRQQQIESNEQHEKHINELTKKVCHCENEQIKIACID
jgi:hypothetical protein